MDETTSLVPMTHDGRTLNKRAQTLALARSQSETSGYVPHLSLADVVAIAEAAGSAGRYPQRNQLLVQTLFDGCLRVSEALGLRPVDIIQDPTGWRLRVLGKGRKPGVVAISSTLAAQLQAYAYRYQILPDQRLFPITRSRAFQIISNAMERAGIRKPDHVGTLHLLRHSGALERLRATGNPKSVQDQLRHTTARMTLRYFKTLQAEESIRIQQGVDFGW